MATAYAYQVRDQLTTIIHALTPVQRADLPFVHRSRPQRLADEGTGMQEFRRFEIVPQGSIETLNFFGMDQSRRFQEFLLMVVYPGQPGGFGNELLSDADKLIDQDWQLLRNTVMDPDNWLAAMQLVEAEHDVEEDDDYFRLVLTIRVQYLADDTQ